MNSALDVAYPTTFYPNAVDSDDAVPIPIRGGERIEANMTLNAQHALRPSTASGHHRQTGLRRLHGAQRFWPVGADAHEHQINNQGDVEISGVIPGQYEVTVTHSVGRSAGV